MPRIKINDVLTIFTVLLIIFGLVAFSIVVSSTESN